MKLKIFLIEDEAGLVEIYEEILEKSGFEVNVMKWGKSALDKLNKIKEGKIEKPDLVLLDLILPDINGMEILERAKREEKTRDIPFFILTNYSDPILEKTSRELGAEKYIIKTEITPVQLVKIIEKWLRDKNSFAKKNEKRK